MDIINQIPAIDFGSIQFIVDALGMVVQEILTVISNNTTGIASDVAGDFAGIGVGVLGLFGLLALFN